MTGSNADTHPAKAPRIWLLLGSKHGDNVQVRTLADRIGEPVREWTLSHNALKECPNALLGASLRSLRQDPGFGAPWPDMVIGVGRRNVPAARWIASHSTRPTKLVWIGRPRAPLDVFDLVLTTPQYGLPAAPNVVELPLPLSPIQPGPGGSRKVAILGGPSWSAAMPDTFLDHFAKTATEGDCSKLSIITSPRSPAHAGEFIRARVGAQVELYDWAAHKGADNPYQTWLSEAASFIASGDSISVISDTVSTGRPVTVLPTPAPHWLSMVTSTSPGRRWMNAAGNAALFAPPPNLAAIFASLLQSGLAEKCGKTLFLPNASDTIAQAQAAAAAKVKSLLD